MNKPNNASLMKEQNRLNILNLVRQAPVSRAELARKTGLTRAAVSIIVDGLIAENLIIEGDQLESTSGRHPTALKINPTAFYSLGIDISRGGCFLALIDFGGNIIKEDFFEFCYSLEKTVDKIIKRLLLLAGDYKIMGVGVTSPGPADIKSGVILSPPGLDLFNHFNIVEALKKEIHLPIYFEKDTNALALAEKAKTNSDNFLFLLADHGLGGAFIKDGALYKGNNGFGCEIGHITLDFTGKQCFCGNRGCAELYTSIPATVELAGEEDYNILCAKAKRDDPIAAGALKYQGKMLGHTIVSCLNIFEPESIILGGELLHGAFILIPEIEEVIKKQALSRGTNTPLIHISCLNKNPRAFASANLVFENYFGKDRL